MMIRKYGYECLQKARILNVVAGNYVNITMGHSNGVMVLFARIFTVINTEIECKVQLEAKLVLKRNTGSL